MVLGREQNSVPCGVHLKRIGGGGGVTEKRKRKKRRKTKLKNPECNVGLLRPSHVSGYITPNCIAEG